MSTDADADGDAATIFEPTIACTVCTSGRRAVDALRVNGQVVALCEVCEKERPTYIRSAGSTARLLGLDVEDVRGLLR